MKPKSKVVVHFSRAGRIACGAPEGSQSTMVTAKVTCLECWRVLEKGARR